MYFARPFRDRIVPSTKVRDPSHYNDFKGSRRARLGRDRACHPEPQVFGFTEVCDLYSGGELDGAREWLHQKVPVLSKRAMIEGVGD